MLRRGTAGQASAPSRRGWAPIVAVAGALVLLLAGSGTASAMQGGSSSADPSIELIPAVSATVDAPASGAAIEIAPAASAVAGVIAAGDAAADLGGRVAPDLGKPDVALDAAAARVLPASRAGVAAAVGRDTAGMANVLAAARVDTGAADAGATTVDDGGVSIELVPATSSEIAPPTAGPDQASGTAALPVAGTMTGAGDDGAASTTNSAPVVVPMAVAPSAGPEAASGPAAGAGGGRISLTWFIGAAIVVLLGGAAVILARARRPVRH
ncbi:MAG: hypothetical protein BGO26_12550 [Actinobacteria bacterium 69-20]|nr:MAG: hypothetical protein BGO26_12550 [Actinobacteria bacterium 69-20]